MAPILPGSTLRPARVVSVDFLSLTSSFLDTPSGDPVLGGFDYDEENDNFAYQRQPHGSTTALSQAAMQGIEDPCLGMKKYIETGGFYHAKQCGWDISVRLGTDRARTWASQPDQGISPLETLDDYFVWNANLLAPFLKFRKNLPQQMRDELDEQALLLPIIQGFIGTAPVVGYTSASETAALSLISRLSCKRAGARFRTRGIDDDGNVANFVETESILCVQDICTSYVQVRGSVPLFWQQPQQGLGTLQQKVEITRPPQASQPAFDKQFMKLLDHYHSVHVINLLGQKDAEAMLSSIYSDHFSELRDSLPPKATSESPGKDDLEYTPYDFHSVVKFGGHEAVRNDFSTSSAINGSIDKFDYTAVDAATGVVIQRQQGVFRENCLDCLDRTNFVQDVVSTLALRRFLASYGSPLLNSPSLWAAHRELWADNGDRLSKTYAGTGALNTSATRTGKKTFAGLLSDATKSVSRAYINNFQDKGKQRAIDMLLGLMAGQRPVILFDPVGDSVHNALIAQKSQYSTPRHLTLFCGTWNLNGRAPAEALDAWLFPSGQPTADIYSVAFQEIVELTPQQIVVTDPAKK
ncbi:hypothetical protein A1Q1_04449 [Trichosporon asahii var. asahii CBS 2479]|uniref:phosphoinositide 5-phosphatase n=1 Tax=Trichosporon asahii var. asahii (strain ATCC 90039 / CBS 2479 / JCM 2466 / KCTC 7840 / NBRC 103889/ NCYC 2677 / UAMH 7654) TaxID=1186058 RepID=J5QDT4_TRIAS|nr:hypothetical protein A1Q1_04449 [Trichosporon asahii var. asahii CBS 2479]EJT46848.1 hypothetical protein A1Q1_04449 [Trichosporon asahii var. asahii CBS 2479]